MAVEFEKANGGTVRFYEKHVVTVLTDQTVQKLIDLEAKSLSSRNWGKEKGDRTGANTLLCMSTGQQQSFLAWIGKFKSDELAKIKKGQEKYTDVAGIPVVGVVVSNGEAWGGGSFTLGIKRVTTSGLKIVHLGRWDWTGTFKLATTATVSSKATS